ncbi:MAG: hypothetical protein QGF46_02960, partial [Planctomycetota bacterium]|nr:hypothetical protein [Planctomycetota bacterium]
EIVDGRQGWLKQMRAALMQSQSQPSLSADEIEIVKSSIEQMLAGIANAPAESAFKFHRDFIAPNGKSLIWNSAGYGSAWFPGFNQKTNKKELLRIFKTNKLRADMQ